MKISKYVKALLILVFIISIAIVTYFFFVQSRRKSPNPLINESNLVRFTELKNESFVKVENEELRIVYYRPEDWREEIVIGEECNPNTDYPVTCLWIYDQNDNFIELKFENIYDDPGGGSISEHDINQHRLFKINGKILALRIKNSNLQDYNHDKAKIGFFFISEAYNDPIESEQYSTKYGDYSYWYVKNNVGYTLSYFIDGQLLDSSNLNDLEVIKTMDQIVASFEIDFGKDIF